MVPWAPERIKVLRQRMPAYRDRILNAERARA
jgi:hypothetical protein